MAAYNLGVNGEGEDMFGSSRPVIARIAVLLLIALGAVACGDFFPSTRSITSVTISPESAAVRPGSTQQFTATGVMGDNTTENVTGTVTWSSSNTTVATIEAGTGLATGVAEGTATITAQASGSVKDSVQLFVTTIQSISVTPENATVVTGQTRQYTATATLADSTTRDVTSQVTWSVADTDVATINSSGLLTAGTIQSATQNTTVTAAFGSISDSATVTVSLF